MKLLPGPLRRPGGKEEEKAEARPNGDGRATALRRPNAPDKEAKERDVMPWPLQSPLNGIQPGPPSMKGA